MNTVHYGLSDGIESSAYESDSNQGISTNTKP